MSEPGLAANVPGARNRITQISRLVPPAKRAIFLGNVTCVFIAPSSIPRPDLLVQIPLDYIPL